MDIIKVRYFILQAHLKPDNLKLKPKLLKELSKIKFYFPGLKNWLYHNNLKTVAITRTFNCLQQAGTFMIPMKTLPNSLTTINYCII
jgi:hypothetical protein